MHKPQNRRLAETGMLLELSGRVVAQRQEAARQLGDDIADRV